MNSFDLKYFLSSMKLETGIYLVHHCIVNLTTVSKIFYWSIAGNGQNKIVIANFL